MSNAFMEARTVQHIHGPKGASAGNCKEAREGGKHGARFGKLGGGVGQAKTKPPPIRITFRMVEAFRAYENIKSIFEGLVDETSESDAKEEHVTILSASQLCNCVAPFVYGTHHEFPQQRMIGAFTFILACVSSDEFQQRKEQSPLEILKRYAKRTKFNNEVLVEVDWNKVTLDSLAKRLREDGKDPIKLAQ